MGQSQLRQFIAIVSVVFLLYGPFFTHPIAISAQAITPVTAKVKHEPIPYFVPEKRIQLDAKVSDEKGIRLVRCYFRGDAAAEFVFVGMEKVDDHEYRAILPAPALYTIGMEYLFLVVNLDNQVVKTQIFKVKRDYDADVPDWQEVSAVGIIPVYTELAKAPETVAGFSDSISLDVVESSARFGMVSGVYSLAAAGSSGTATGEAATATTGGTVTATAGISTTVVVATAAGIAVAGGAALALGGGGGSGDSEINTIASITWWDDDSPTNDAFEVFFDNSSLGTSPLNSSFGKITKKELPVGEYTLVITCISAAGDMGNFIVDLGGGAIFKNDGSTQKKGGLPQGGSRSYQVIVPELADTNVMW